MMSPQTDTAATVLFPYFKWADELRGRFRDIPADDDALATMYVRSWLGALHALLEGWKASSLSHPVVSPLLGKTTGRNLGPVDGPPIAFEYLLQAARRDVFHYSGGGSPPGIALFMRTPGALEWAYTLHRAFESFFAERLRAG